MTFRVSKYTFNSWKNVAADKNNQNLIVNFPINLKVYGFFLIFSACGYLAVNVVNLGIRENKIILKRVYIRLH